MHIHISLINDDHTVRRRPPVNIGVHDDATAYARRSVVSNRQTVANLQKPQRAIRYSVSHGGTGTGCGMGGIGSFA